MAVSGGKTGFFAHATTRHGWKYGDHKADQDRSSMRRKIVADAGATREGRPGHGLIRLRPLVSRGAAKTV